MRKAGSEILAQGVRLYRTRSSKDGEFDQRPKAPKGRQNCVFPMNNKALRLYWALVSQPGLASMGWGH